MKKAQITLMILFSSIFLTSGALAQNKPLACQADATAGLKWESGQWITKSFTALRPRFILVQAGMTLTTDSVGRALGANPVNVSCRNAWERIECTDKTGGSLLFDPKKLKGGISQLFGVLSDETEKDTVTVQIFSCTPF
jgi:hypothetical protein